MSSCRGEKWSGNYGPGQRLSTACRNLAKRQVDHLSGAGWQTNRAEIRLIDRSEQSLKFG